MRVEDALTQLRTIQSQLDRAQARCCYRWATVASSGLLALLAAAVQPVYLPDPALDLRRYLTLWISVAAASVTVIAIELVQKLPSQAPFARRQTLAALRQFAPCVAAGALVTWAIAATSPEHTALLPGLWAVIFSLGVFASAAHLPSGAVAVAGYYLLTGIMCIVWGQGDQALRPWTMVVTFAVGQFLAAIVLYRRHERESERGDE